MSVRQCNFPAWVNRKCYDPVDPVRACGIGINSKPWPDCVYEDSGHGYTGDLGAAAKGPMDWIQQNLIIVMIALVILLFLGIKFKVIQ